MSAKYEVTEKNKVLITVDVEPEKFEAALNRSFERNRKKFKIKGFRDGKAPRKMVEQVYGIGAFYDGAFQHLVPQEYEAAVKELNIVPVSEPDYSIVEVEGNSKLVFTASVFVKPEVKLGEYKGIEIKRISTEVTDGDVDAELKRLAEEDYRLEPVEGRPAKDGDSVLIDYAGSVDGVAFEGGTAEGQNLVLGSGSFIPGFEDQIVGHNVGDEFVVNVTFPEEYHAADLAGKAAEFKVVLHDIKEKVIPEINDDFAAEKSEFETLAEYREDLKKKLAEKKEKDAKRDTENELIAKAAENAEIDIPECMFDNAVENMLENYRRQISNYGIKFEDYLKMTGNDIESVKEQIRPNAERQVREQLVLEAIAETENLKASDEQIEERLREMATMYKADYDEMVKNLSDESKEFIASDLKPMLAIDFLVANAKYVD
ncbi:MAG: trigger factor [Clostridia bacterium]|nr:trigger factor [Clostridia bacterium]